MALTSQEITFYAGDTKTVAIPLKTEVDGAAFSPGSDYHLIFTAKASNAASDAGAKFQYSSGAGIVDPVVSSSASVTFHPADTRDQGGKTLYWDIQAEHETTGVILTVAYGTLVLKRDTTRQTTTSVPIHTLSEAVPYTGPSAYDSYVSTTSDDPVLSEAAWIASLSADVDADTVVVASPAEGDMIQRVGGSWVTRTIAQIKTALGLGSAAYTASTAYATASHAHEGTAVLSTGETGGTKYLREDGDGTSSWQTIPGGGASGVLDLTTTTLAATNMLRVAAAGGLEERTPAEVLADIGAEPALSFTPADAADFIAGAGALTGPAMAGVASIEGHTHVSADITDAISTSTPDTLVLRGANGEAVFGDWGNSFAGNGVFSMSDSGIGVFGESSTGYGVVAQSVSGPGSFAASTSGTNHAEFGTYGDDMSFIRRVLGLIGWQRGSYVQTLGSPATLTADSALTLPDAVSGTLALTSDITPEGTAIKSTGEAGGTKFLRENGDGTCSWQAAGGGSTIVGITGTLAEFNTACTDADFAPIASPAFTGAVTLSGQSLTGSQATPLVDASTTWNTTGNPVMVKLAATNTASGATSKFLSCLAGASGTTEVFSITKSGRVNATGVVSLGAALWSEELGRMRTYSTISCNGNGIYFDSATSNTLLIDETAHVLALRNGTNAQTTRLYTTFTARGAGTTNLEALETRAQAAGSFIIQSLKGSAGGTARDIEFRHGATDTNNVITAGTLIATVTAGGFVADGGLKLGAKTVGTLPTASSNTYLEFVVTDSLTPAVGAVVAAGGSAKAKVISNGTDWIVTSTL